MLCFVHGMQTPSMLPVGLAYHDCGVDMGPCKELLLLQVHRQGEVGRLLPGCARPGKVLVVWDRLHLAITPLHTP